MNQRLLRTSRVPIIAVGLLLGGGSAGSDLGPPVPQP